MKLLTTTVKFENQHSIKDKVRSDDSLKFFRKYVFESNFYFV